MNAHEDNEHALLDGTVTLALEPDILTLAAYLARKRDMTLDTFVEYLITKEASKGKTAADSLHAPAIYA